MPAPVRILEISPYVPPHTGWSVRVRHVRRALEAGGHDCEVLNIGPSRRIPSSEYETVQSFGDYLRKVWRFLGEGYVVHCHVNGASLKGLAMTIAAQLLSRMRRQPCVLTFHAGLAQVYFPRPKAPFLLPAYRMMFDTPRAIICNSPDVKAKIAEYGADEEKIVPIPGFSRQYLEEPSTELPIELEAFYRDHSTIVLWYTKLRPLFVPEAAIEGIARLVERHPDLGLVVCGMVGHHDEHLRRRVEQRMAMPDLRDRVIAVNDLAHPAFLAALGRATIYLRTHLSDGVCASILEALSLRVPVVATDNGARPDGVIAVPADDPVVLAQALDHTIRHHREISTSLTPPPLRDTVRDEVDLLTAIGGDSEGPFAARPSPAYGVARPASRT